MSKINYRISKQAIEDLNDIWVYTFHKWSKAHADRYYDLIIAEIEFISGNFLLGKSAELTRKNYRVTKIKSNAKLKIIDFGFFWIRFKSWG